MRQLQGRVFGKASWSAAFLLIALMLTKTVQAAEPAPVVVYAYHLKPPFIVDVQHEQGLYYDFSAYVNRKLGKALLRTEYMPRKRLDQLAQSSDFDGVIIGVNPLWFHDIEEQRYLWTSTLMKDRDELVSPADRPVNYNGPESLSGKTIGLVNGLYYYGIDEAAAAGQLTREDTNSELQNLTKLRVHRIDATVISRSTFDYLVKHFGGRELYYLSERPHDVFARRILVPFKRRDVYDWLEPIMQKLATDPEWRTIVKSYQ
ncbi:transporter substrate-binding domain-containing protein [Permianibacter sp. IMCC34836]|uniref:substrate-binding periplasmic protein n=1 Tax=Permianibacter fluminis TaxID=2738515 RepID=UPI001554B7B9|nr:transporter substrate-binding domain-containing protein [Permianibacter fluminis]NQD36446.1 transporter substrate-binding domain-containing protein [Permianibacter fluminis]